MKKHLMVTRKEIIPGGVYHITQRAPGREQLFLEDDDYLHFLKLLKETAHNFVLDVFGFALLPNHLHILLRIIKANLNKAMKYIYQSYAESFNKKYQRKGHVFCGVYRAAFCEDDAHLLASSIYIHLNPYKAGLTDDVFNYRWFSLEPYIKPMKTSFLKTDFILSMLETDKDKAASIYTRLISESIAFKYKNFLEDQNAINKFTADFMEWLKPNLNTIIPAAKHPAFYRYFDLENQIGEVKLKKRLSTPETKKAAIYLIEQLKSRGYSISDIATRLNISRMSLYRLIKDSGLTL